MSRIPPTIHGLNALHCISALQKFIRRAMEREAMEVAVELHLTSKAFATMLCNRLEVISHEDLDTGAAPHIVPFVHTAMNQAHLVRPGEARPFAHANRQRNPDDVPCAQVA
jgi:hypothetical protein